MRVLTGTVLVDGNGDCEHLCCRQWYGHGVLQCVGNEALACAGCVLQVKLAGGEVIGAPTPADVMASASRTVLSKLDRVEGEVIDFFMPAASRLIAGPHPERVLAAALAAMSGFR